MVIKRLRKRLTYLRTISRRRGLFFWQKNKSINPITKLRKWACLWRLVKNIITAIPISIVKKTTIRKKWFLRKGIITSTNKTKRKRKTQRSSKTIKRIKQNNLISLFWWTNNKTIRNDEINISIVFLNKRTIQTNFNQ